VKSPLPARSADVGVISGPSILGLDAESQVDNVSYLLDDEAPSGHPGRWLFLLFVVLCGAGAYYAYQKYYPLPSFAANLPGPKIPAFAYDRTPPESFAPDIQPVLPSNSLRDQLALANIADTMKKVKAQDTAVHQTSAMLAQGEKYLYGRGVITNCDLARKSFEDAAKIGNSVAMAHLGSMYGAGRCVKFNRVKAYEWFAKAKNADPNNTWVESSMDMLWRNMSRTERATILK
jgi:hypothetical protein